MIRFLPSPSRLAGALGAAIALAPLAAHADPPNEEAGLRLPVPEAQRPLTLPRLVLAPEGEFQVDHRPNEGVFGELDLSVGFGITDDLAISALVAPLELWAPGTKGPQYGESNRNLGPGAGATYRFAHPGSVELGVGLSGSVFTVPDVSGGLGTFTFLLHVHATNRVRLDLEPAVSIVEETTTTVATVITTPGQLAPPPQKTSSTTGRVQAPLRLTGNLTRSFDVDVFSGLTIYNTSNTRASTGIPLGFGLGYAVPGPQGPVLDVNPFFDFPYLVMPGRTGSQSTNTQQYQVGVTLRGYLYL